MECLFCGSSVERSQVQTVDGRTIARITSYECIGSCQYCFITDQAYEFFSERLKNDPLKRIICQAEAIKPLPDNVIRFWKMKKENADLLSGYSLSVVDIDEISEGKIQHSKKFDELLYCVSKKTEREGPFFGVNLLDEDRIRMLMLDEYEAQTWLNELVKRGLIHLAVKHDELKLKPISGMSVIRLTPDGWHRIEEIRKGIESKIAFVAMSFTTPDRDAIFQAIKSACAECGFEAKIVSEEHFNDGITDKIIALINESKFVIADYTENKRGVYYEAGYAAGLGRDVIHLVRRGYHDGSGMPVEAQPVPDDSEEIKLMKVSCRNEFKIHFDTQHLNYIIWDSMDEIKSRLIDRIKATMIE